LETAVVDQLRQRNGILAIRASSAKQGIDGDSPEAQHEQGIRFAVQQNINLVETLTYLESASQVEQPMQNVIDYCKKHQNEVDVVIVKSIDRFTRGGSTVYDQLKMQLEPFNIDLIDIYGVISNTKVNTLEHLGFEYSWSTFSPSRKTELLEAERAKDEMRDIMSRMIGAEIRYTRMGYWLRRQPFGYDSMSLDTQNGKRRVLTSHPTESPFIIKMFELRSRGTLNDHQILAEINKLGYKSRVDVLRDKHDRAKIIGQMGGNELDMKGLFRYLENPIYAGINCEKWTDYKPIRCKFNGLVSIEMFNKANKGKVAITEVDGQLSIYKRQPAAFQLKKRVVNPDFPYKKLVMCPGCHKPLAGSASRGKLGKYYPAYHCSRYSDHHYRIPKEKFDQTVELFVKKVQFETDYMEALEQAVLKEWDKRQVSVAQEEETIETRIASLKVEARMMVDKIKVLSSETAIKYMEEDLMKVDEQITNLSSSKEIAMQEKPMDIRVVMGYIKYFVAHLDYLLLKQIDPLKKANFLGVLFKVAPTYDDLICGTQNLGQITGLSEVFKHASLGNIEGQLGLDPRTPCLRGRCSNQLS
jgi:site-specific DNA recombinase